MKYLIKLKRNAGISKEELLIDLKRVANKLGKSPTMDEYDTNGNFGRGVFKNKFVTWNNALSESGLSITKRGNNTVTEEMLFDNIMSVWEKLGKQPSQNDLNNKDVSRFSAGAYKNKFGTYNKALTRFEKWTAETDPINTENTDQKSRTLSFRRTKRQANLRLRWEVMKRDNFRCVKCGWLPAMGIDRILEIDHIIPWDKQGETVKENLQTLCSVCNSGKSNLI